MPFPEDFNISKIIHQPLYGHRHPFKKPWCCRRQRNCVNHANKLISQSRPARDDWTCVCWRSLWWYWPGCIHSSRRKCSPDGGNSKSKTTSYKSFSTGPLIIIRRLHSSHSTFFWYSAPLNSTPLALALKESPNAKRSPFASLHFHHLVAQNY